MDAPTLRMLAALGLAALCLNACSQGGGPVAETQAVQPGDAGTTVARSQPRLVYSWVDEAGHVHMSSRIEQVPAAYRARVTVTDLARPRRQRLADDRVVVLDLRREGAARNYSLVDLRRLSAGVAPRTHLSESARLAQRLEERLRGAVLGWLGIRLLATGAGSATVILYSAPWCGFCKKAAAYLRRRGVAFRERDIEADPRAAAELQAKLARAGQRSAGIPVLDIAGRLVVGFDEKRIAELLERLERTE